MPGTFVRAIAIMPPGMFLSQPPTASTPSIAWPLTLVSIASAMTSRETSEYFIASVPMPMPSVTVRHADDRLVEIGVAEADGAQHRAVRRARNDLGDELGATVVVGHAEFSLRAESSSQCNRRLRVIPYGYESARFAPATVFRGGGRADAFRARG